MPQPIWLGRTSPSLLSTKGHLDDFTPATVRESAVSSNTGDGECPAIASPFRRDECARRDHALWRSCTRRDAD